MSRLKEGKLSLSTAALLVVAFSKAGELTGPLATAVARRLCTAFRAAARGGASSLLLGEGGSPLDKTSTLETGETDFRVHFADGATVLLAMKEGELLHDPAAGVAARELQEQLLVCVQPQWNSLTFSQLRRLFLLLGATAEPLGLDMAAARELLIAAKRHLRKMQKTSRRLFDDGDARDTVALVWPLACVSAALQLPPPQSNSSNNTAHSSPYGNSNNEDMQLLHKDRDIVLQLVKWHVHRAVSSRLPCSPFDFALGYAGLERLGQHSCAEYVLAAFSTAAAAADGEELCRLGRDIMLAGARQKALWEAFGAAVQTAMEQRQQTPPGKQHSSASHRIEAELAQWLRFCGRTI
ncbi:hypothetical protein, conserved [Eimeria brunetti]|uniref:Uncharacterized protein n=1 Tax=Eimeria brunetti TaxID=51314 RepID=U6LVP2_9EIME|nr:hypothetical protein, conserved [Eimeria brunetti]